MTDKNLADALAAKLLGLLMDEFRTAGLAAKDADETLVNTVARMLERGYAVRGLNYPERLLRRLVARTSPVHSTLQ
jgi:hypothetical protein